MRAKFIISNSECHKITSKIQIITSSLQLLETHLFLTCFAIYVKKMNTVTLAATASVYLCIIYISV